MTSKRIMGTQYLIKRINSCIRPRGWIIKYCVPIIVLMCVLPLCADEAEKMYKKGEEYFDQGEFGKAIEQFTNFCGKFPTNMLLPYAFYNLGWANFYVEEYEEAISSFRKLIGTFPGSELNEEANLAVAESLRGNESFDEAIRAYSDFVRKFPKSSTLDQAVYGLAWSYYGKKDFPKAITTLKRFIQLHGKSSLASDAHYFLATIYSEIGKVDKAVETFGELTGVKEDPVVANRAYFVMGQTLFDSKNFRQAIRFFRKVRSTGSMTSLIQEKIAVLDNQLRKAPKTLRGVGKIRKETLRLEAIRKGLESSKEDLCAAAWYSMGLAYHQLDRYYEARIAYVEVLRRFEKVALRHRSLK